MCLSRSHRSTIAVGRHVLVIADVRVEPGSDIAGRRLADLESYRLSLVLALAQRGTPRFDWSPPRNRPLVAGDRLIVLATNGNALSVSPYTGDPLGQVAMSAGGYLGPVIADNSMYLLTDDANLSGTWELRRSASLPR